MRFGMKLVWAIAAVGLTSAATFASYGVSPPSEMPPSNFTSAQFVDSKGCVYVRAQIGGQERWVPRVSRDREPVCGFEPTFGEAEPPVVSDEPTSIADLGVVDIVPAMAAAPEGWSVPERAPKVALAAPSHVTAPTPDVKPGPQDTARAMRSAAIQHWVPVKPMSDWSIYDEPVPYYSERIAERREYSLRSPTVASYERSLPKPPAGYERVFQDGRLNPLRGVSVIYLGR